MATIKDLIDTTKKFITQYDREPVLSNAGNGFKDEYGARIDKDGKLVVKKKGTFDLYSYIQSFEESTNIEVLLKRFANGDENALMQRKGEYLDITDMPNTYAELLNKMKDGKELFDALPLDVKNKYDNSFEKWIVTAGSIDWLKDMKLYQEPIIKEESLDVKLEKQTATEL